MWNHSAIPTLPLMGIYFRHLCFFKERNFWQYFPKLPSREFCRWKKKREREKSSININMNLKTWATTGKLGCSSLKYSPPTRHWGCHQGLGHFPSDTATHRHLCSLASAKSSFALCFHVVFEGGLSKQIWETTWLAGDSKWEAVSKTERGFYPSEI